jgi:protein SCO1/2
MRSFKQTQKLIFAMSCVVAGILSFMVYQKFSQPGPEQDLKAQYLPAGDFSLQTRAGLQQLSDFRGKPVVLYFGFTSCPDICPLGLSTIRDALNSDLGLNEVVALFVTLDPQRDTLERLSEYTEFFHPNIVAMRGDQKETAKIAKQYGTYFIKAPLPGAKERQNALKGDVNIEVDPNAYTVDHTAYYFVLDKMGELTRVLEHNTKANELAAALLSVS